jgi:hypothetical protein
MEKEKSVQIHNPIRLKSMQHIQQPESCDQFLYGLYNIILVREVAKRYGGEASQRATVSSASSWEFNYRLVASPGTGGASSHPFRRARPPSPPTAKLKERFTLGVERNTNRRLCR